MTIMGVVCAYQYPPEGASTRSSELASSGGPALLEESLDDLDFVPGCSIEYGDRNPHMVGIVNVEPCPNPAAYLGITACCGDGRLLCERCSQVSYRAFICPRCKTETRGGMKQAIARLIPL